MKKKVNHTDIVIFQAKSGAIEFRGDFSKETIWATLDQIASLFDRDKSVVSRHLKNIFNEAELDKMATVAKNATVQMEGDREVIREIEYYNLDAIISVGYRVNSKTATNFRQWATKILDDATGRFNSWNKFFDENRIAMLSSFIQGFGQI